jgi:hypothetical protein
VPRAQQAAGQLEGPWKENFGPMIREAASSIPALCTIPLISNFAKPAHALQAFSFAHDTVVDHLG